MRDEKNAHTALKATDGTADVLGGFHVEITTGLIKNKHSWLPQQGPCNRKALLLPAR